jgi:hypothetical protein
MDLTPMPHTNEKGSKPRGGRELRMPLALATALLSSTALTYPYAARAQVELYQSLGSAGADITSKGQSGSYNGGNGGSTIDTQNPTIRTDTTNNSNASLGLGGVLTSPLSGDSVVATSIGGNGGANYPGDDVAGTGGNGGTVSLTLNPNVTVGLAGTNEVGVFAESAGGDGAGLSSGSDHFSAYGGAAGSVTVQLNNSSTITGSAAGDSGIAALSIGGSSGATDNQYSSAGGNAGAVTVTLESGAAIDVGSNNGSQNYNSSFGVEALSIGGLSWYGNSRGEACASSSCPYYTSQDGSGSTVTVSLATGTSITTAGTLGIGVLAASTGGNVNGSEDPPDSYNSNEADNSANSAPSTLAPTGNAGTVSVTASGSIATSGLLGIGIVAASTTGGAGVSSSGSPQVGAGSGSPGTVAVTLNPSGTITTSGIAGIGILGLSLGGSGGVVESKPGLLNWFGDTTPGSGVNGNTVSISYYGTIVTTGTVGIGIVAQSIGGGGGTATGTAGLFAVGGDGGAGGNGGNVTVNGTGAIATSGDGAPGILAQSIGGGGGSGANATGLAVSVGGAAGASGNSGYSTVNITGALSTQGDYAPGVMAQVIGGGGGNGGYGETYSISPVSAAVGGSGSAGGYAATAEVESAAALSTAGEHSAGLLVQSIGGGGGSGGQGSDDSLGVVTISVTVGGSGGAGGNGGNSQALNTGRIATSGPDSIGILAQSVGGGGGNGGASVAKSLSIGATADVPAISVPISVGGSGEASGNGHPVFVSNYGGISTTQDGSEGILAQSIGGGGGNGGDSSAAAAAATAGAGVAVTLSTSIGGHGGAGGTGGSVTVYNGNTGYDPTFDVQGSAGTITTAGNDAAGIVAQSIGGGGGNGGAGDASSKSLTVPDASDNTTIALGVSVGGNAAGGSTGGAVTVTNAANSSISTDGGGSQGILAQSIGGGGGDAGGGTVSTSAQTGSLDVTVGGGGGNGSNGGLVTVTNNGTITTAGGSSDGIAAQSIGGSGGYGGSADSTATVKDSSDDSSSDGSGTSADSAASTAASDASSADSSGSSGSTSFGVTVGVGGGGGGSSSGGAVTVTNTNLIQTSGEWSNGILAQSIGGGGGAGGGSTSTETGGTIGASVSVSGSGGSGGNGASVTVTNSGTLMTIGAFSNGILAQSIGGGGGEGGESNAGMSGSYSVGVGYSSKAGGGGNGGTVNVTDSGTIQTSGEQADAILAQSIGGGGGVGGASSGSTTDGDYSATVSVGGSGGVAGSGGSVTVTTSGPTLATSGVGADAILAQSIGGGGGSGGAGSADSESGTLNLGAGVSGKAGGGGTGGGVTVTNAAQITTSGSEAYGVLAQSIGGGGGVADEASSSTSNGTFSGTVSVGGNGGSGNNGGTVTVSDSGAVTTAGTMADAVLVQSIGGGGGAGGQVSSNASSLTASLNIGGSGSAGGTGGTVTFETTGAPTIATTGYASDGIAVQSIGGGGGVGGASTGSSDGSVNLNLGFNGSGGNGATGGWVYVTEAGKVSTAGDDSYGILAQSIGGGGGAAAAGTGFSASGGVLGSDGSITNPSGYINPRLSLSYNIGGDSGSSGSGNTVNVTASGAISTTGARSFGIVAQSIGGGGGIATAAAQNLASTGLADHAGADQATGGPVNITLGPGGSISTAGAGAWGILAQSIGGGGGLDGDPSLALTTLQSNTLSETGQGNAYANAVTVNVNGNITTTGANAHGIFAQSIGGSGGIVAGGSDSTSATALAGNAAQIHSSTNQTYWGSGGAIYITQAAGTTIKTSGLGSIGIIAQSSGVNAQVSRISVTTDGTVIGGSNGGQPVAAGMMGAVGIAVSGGGNSSGFANTVTVQPAGSVSTMDGVNGTAIWANDGVTNVSNSGTITGNINLGATPGTITNNDGGTLQLGSSTTASSLTNNGTVFVQGGTTALNGNFTQGSTGIYSYDYAAGVNHTLAVSGLATLGGEVAPIVGSSFLPYTDTIFTAGKGLSGSVTTPQTLLFHWVLEQNGSTFAVQPQQNFETPQGASGTVQLTSLESDLARYLAKAWDNSDGSLASVFASLYTIPEGGGKAYFQALAAHSPYASAIGGAVAKGSASGTLTSAFSCPVFEDDTTLLGEGSCVWVRVGGTSDSQYAAGGQPGFSTTGATYTIGGQKEFIPNWFFGGAFGAGTTWSNSDGSNSQGQIYNGTLALKHEIGQWLFEASFGVSSGSFQNNRAVQTGSGNATLQSDSSSLMVGSALRAAYTVPMKGWYVRPYTDLDIYNVNTPGYSESGLRGYALTVDGDDTTNVTVSPMVEVGGRLDTGWKSMILRYYTDLGVTFLPGNSRTVNSSIEGALTQDGTFATPVASPDVLGDIDFGLQLYQADGFEVKADYGVQLGGDYFGQGGTLRLAYHFL